DVHDVLHVAEGLDVVDDGRALVEAEHRREVGRLDAGVGAFAFEGLDEAGLLATDVGAGAAVNVDLAAVTGAEYVLADEALGLRLGDGFFKDTGAFGHLAADVDVGLLHVVGEARDHGALDQLVRILVHDVAVFERAGLGFVGVDDEVDGLAAFAINERPLEAAREAGAAAAAQAGFFDLFAQVFGLLGDGLFEHLVATVAQVALDVVGVAGLVDVLEDDAGLGGCGHR